MANGLIRCAFSKCANSFFSEMASSYCCNALSECMVDPNTGCCPFFKGRERGERDRETAYERAKSKGLLGPDGLYQGPRYTKYQWETQKDGSQKGTVVPDIKGWLNHLAQDGIIQHEVAERYMETES